MAFLSNLLVICIFYPTLFKYDLTNLKCIENVKKVTNYEKKLGT